MTMVKVARMPQTVEYGDKKYGPSDGPMFIPLELAVALGLRPVDGGSAVAASDDAQAQELAAAQNLAGQFQRNLELLVEQLRPHVKADLDETPDQTLARMLVEREQFKATAQDKVDSLRSEAERLSAEVERLKKDLDSRTREAQHAVEQWTATTEERNQLQKQLADTQALPTDARDRLIAVKGISDALADAALAALTAKGGEK